MHGMNFKQNKERNKPLKSLLSLQGGESGVSGSSGFSISAHKSVGVPTTVVKETEVSVIPVKSVHAAVQGESKLEAANEITSSANADLEANAHVNVNAQPEIVKEVSTWEGPHFYRRKIPQFRFQDIISSLFRSPQRSYRPPIRVPPPQYNYIQQVC